MPLVRVEVRNEYGLGASELYKDADKEDPKTLLEGLAVAGLVGILRQLGDLAEFAAEVFHGIQEQVTITSSRSHKLMGRVKQIEAALPPLEKLVLAQSSHLHFAYTPGLNWRANLHNEKSHFIYSDLPRFMMNSYEQCRGPPNLNLLDKFDPGGPGSCLKRYSDPSFFRKTLKRSGLVQKKSRKIKKKRSWPNNGETSRRVSNYSGSDLTRNIHFPSLNIGEQTSPCPTVSTYELKDLDLGYQSLSFDSRNESVDFEHVSSQQRFPIPPYKERDSTGSGSSQSRMHHKDAVLYCDSPSSISGEVMGFKSNQVTWDEKMEMLVGATREEHDHDEILEKSSTNLSVGYNESGGSHLRDESMEDLENDDKVSNHFHTYEVNHQKGSLESLSTNVNVENPRDSVASETDHDDLNCGNVVEMNTHLVENNILLSNSGDIQRDEIESETDHFVDALNAIESEYESDVDCQTKQEMEQDRLTTPPDSGIISSNPEIVHTNGSLNNDDTSGIHPDLDFLEFCSEVNASPDKANSVPFESHASFQPQLPDLLKNDNVRNVSFLGGEVSKPPPEPFTSVSTMLWTNGGLLGLEPSKPPDFSSANMAGQVPGKSKEETITYIPKSNVTEKSDTTSIKEVSLSECSTSYQDDTKNGNLTRKSQRKSLSTDLGSNLLKLSDSYHQNNASYIQPGGDVQPVRPDIKSNSSRMLELGNKLLINGFYRKPELLKDENSYPTDSGFEKSNGYNMLPGSESPLISPPSSPPLGHMKISFQPINGSKAPNLQLKLPGGNSNHEGGRDLFTSFQLVPDPSSIEFRDFVSDSDDDTFDQSSPNGSDNISHQSDSNSEQWESRESPSSNNKEKDLYDALRRISLTESVPISSGTSEIGQFPRDTVDGSYSSHLYDELPNLESIHPSFKEIRPESQWQAMGPQLELPESRQINMPEEMKFTLTQKPKPAPQSQEGINGDAYLLNIKSQNLRKFKPVKKFSQASNGNLEQKGDFLQQIRAKSLNLRPTAIPKPTVAADMSNIQVNAILEKANAIRKAVGSDREDDNWSDT